MGTKSFMRKAAHRLVQRKQPLLEPLECADASLGVSGMAKTAISPLKKPQGKELGKWRGSVSRVRRFLGRWSSKSLGSDCHSGDAGNIAVDLEDSRDGEGSGRPLPTSSPQVSNLPTPQTTQTSQSLHLNRDEDPVARRREMKLAALEQAQIQEELSEAARLRGGCVPCSKGKLTIAHPQSSDPGLSIVAEEQSREKPPPGPPCHPAQSRSRAASQAANPTSTKPQTRQRRLAIKGEGPPPSRPPSLPGKLSNTAPPAGSGPTEGNTLHDPGCR